MQIQLSNSILNTALEMFVFMENSLFKTSLSHSLSVWFSKEFLITLYKIMVIITYKYHYHSHK